VAAAFDADGQPTAAATGFARSVGKRVDELERLVTNKGEWLQCTVEIPGQPLESLLFPLLEEALQRLPVPRPMRWSDHDDSFVRPVHWLLVLHGERAVPGTLFGCEAGRETRGHRIHAPGPHELDRAENYLSLLRDACVEADQDERRERIRRQARKLGEAEGGVTRITDELLDEVNNLVEWPVAVAGHFDERFLEVPQEALIASMESHQKFFPVLTRGSDQQGHAGEDAMARLSPVFVIIANLESKQPEAMIEGYERVMRPRLADADFFWNQDLKTPLEDRLPELDRVRFQDKLGSVGDKSRRIGAIAREIAEHLSIEPGPVERAARLCKCDLLTQMVNEFPELQGVMGGHYARADGEPEAVVAAITEHYHPRFAGDALPGSDAGRIVALADRLDTLVGIFAAGLKPTGNKDPFALRRNALGLVRILVESGWPLELDRLLAVAANTLAHQLEDRTAASPEVLADLRIFILERARSYFQDLGASTRQLNATMAAPLGTLTDLKSRIEAVGDFMAREEGEILVSANKRIGNILRKEKKEISTKIDENLFVFDEEIDLFAAVRDTEDQVMKEFGQGEYAEALERLAALREPVDRYFEQVMVMDEDPVQRGNRLATLARLKSLFDRVADFSVVD
jgi:glycyl-tRNA synthetase beta chain